MHEVEGFDVVVTFDGGSFGNPGRGYGSYHVWEARGGEVQEQLELGDCLTNNEAEYLALTRALEAALARAAERGEAPERLSLLVLGDSRLVIEQVRGRWKVRADHLRPYHARVRSLLSRFGRSELRWQPRAASLRRFGH